jgi:hypothetical protein
MEVDYKLVITYLDYNGETRVEVQELDHAYNNRDNHIKRALKIINEGFILKGEDDQFAAYPSSRILMVNRLKVTKA